MGIGPIDASGLTSSSSASTGPIHFSPTTVIGDSRGGFDWQAWMRGAGGGTAAELQASATAGGTPVLLIVVVVLALLGALIYFKRG